MNLQKKKKKKIGKVRKKSCWFIGLIYIFDVD